MEAGSVHAIVTDPPWPDKKVDTGWLGPDWWAEVCALMERIIGPEGKMILIVSSDADPRPLIGPILLPFVHCCWMRYVPPHHRGPVLRFADVAYQFGRPYLPKGKRNLPEECVSPSSHAGKVEKDYLHHPCPRNLGHMRWLLRTQVGPGRKVCDPFMGSGTTGVAAVFEGLDFVGMEISLQHYSTARRRIDAAQQGLGFVEAEGGQKPLWKRPE